MNKKFTEKEILQMIDRHFKDSVPIYKIAKENNVTRKCIQNYFRQKGLVGNNLNYKVSDTTVFSQIDTEEKAYWLGFLYADGAISKNNRVLELSLKISDIEHLKKFKLFLSSNIEIKTDLYRCRFIIGSKQLCNDLIKLGCYNCKSLSLEFPLEKQVSKYLQIHFIRGYFDGDGCINNPLKNGYSCSVLGTINVLSAIKNITNLQSIQVKKSTSNCYMLNLHGNNSRNFLTLLYKNSSVYLERKYYRFLINIACYNRNIIMKEGKISEIHYDNLDNTERVALEYLINMQSLQSIEVKQLSKNTSKSLLHLN